MNKGLLYGGITDGILSNKTKACLRGAGFKITNRVKKKELKFEKNRFQTFLMYPTCDVRVIEFELNKIIMFLIFIQ